MSGSPRDLAAPEPWRASLERSRARRKPASNRRPAGAAARTTPARAGGSALRLASLIDARKRLPSPRDLADSDTWELSLVRSRTRRRAAELRFVPTTTRARRVSLGTLIAIAAGPAAGLAATSGASHLASAAVPEPATTTEHVLTIESGNEGRQVRMLQQALGIQVDGVFGPETEAAVRAFQQSHNLTVDGIVGSQTSAALAASAPIAAATAQIASMMPTPRQRDAVYTGAQEESASSTNPVVRLQEALGVQVDGTFGPETERAVRHLQASRRLNVDGVVGSETWRVLKINERATLHPVHFRGAASQPAGQPLQHHANARIASVEGDTNPTSGHSAEAPSHGEGAPITSRTDAVRRLQEALGIEADGTFGPETEAAVKHYQSSHGLEVDGVVGPQTWQKLGINTSMTLHPPHSATPHSSSGGGESSSTGGEESGVVARVIAAADEIATRPYVYGGGHGSFNSYGYDCSGSVSYALHGGGLLSSPEDSSELESYGDPGPGQHITIYANAEHAWMTIDGRRFDTVAQQESGSRWSDSMASTGGYVVRHPPGL